MKKRIGLKSFLMSTVWAMLLLNNTTVAEVKANPNKVILVHISTNFK